MDVTAILDENGEQIFSTARILKASTTPTNTYAQHPLEDGTVISDNKIRNQTRINMSVILDSNDYPETYKSIKEASNNSTRFIIQTRVDNYDNMYIEAYPNEESADIYDTIGISIDFIEQFFGTVETAELASSDVANQSDTDTNNRGEQLPAEVNTTLAQDIASGIQGLF